MAHEQQRDGDGHGNASGCRTRCGLAALFLEANPDAGPKQVQDSIVQNAEAGLVSDPGYAPNRLALKFTGTLSGTGADENQPWSNSYYAPPGWHHAWLRGPKGSNYNMELWQYTDATGWVKVAQRTTASANEEIVYYGPEGLFHYRIFSASGGGAYDLFLLRP